MGFAKRYVEIAVYTIYSHSNCPDIISEYSIFVTKYRTLLNEQLVICAR